MILSLNGIIAAGKNVVSTLLNSLVSAYKAENNANDSLGTNNGTAQGGLTYSTGVDGQAFNFNGTNAYVTLPSDTLTPSGDFSFSLWFNTNSASTERHILSNVHKQGGAAGQWKGWDIFTYTSKVYFRLWNTNVNSDVISTTTIVNSTWYKVTVTKSGATQRIYINGTLEATNNSAVTPNYTSPNYPVIGAQFYHTSAGYDSSTLFNGKIDEISIWNKELTATEVTELYRCGSGSFYPYTSLPTLDSDACAFISAATITDTTQQSAINQLVLDLKSANIWTKMKAIYPFVGGTATTHKFNLKDPRDLDAAYRLVFNGGWTHSATGALPNGTTAYADTKLAPSSTLTQWNTHLSYYSRTSTRISTSIEIGSYDGSSSNLFSLILPRTSGLSTSTMYSQATSTDEARTTTATDASGLFIGTRTSNTANTHKLFRNGAVIGTASTSAGTLLSNPLYIGAMRTGASAGAYSNKESAFASIGDGLTDTEAADFYTAVQTFQTTLGRQVGVPIVADSDAQAFLNAAEITDQTQANAINTLVTDLKTANIWTKMKAIYPFVGGTASQHRFNLKDPRALDIAFYLTFYGGGTHSANGYQPDGATAYADTKLNPNTVLTSLSHLSYYSRTDSTVSYLIGNQDDQQYGSGQMYLLGNKTNDTFSLSNTDAQRIISSSTSTLGLYLASRTSSTSLKGYKNGVNVGTNTFSSAGYLPNINLYIGGFNYKNFLGAFTTFSGNKECAFSSIGDGLTDAEATALHNAVNTFQVALSRNV